MICTETENDPAFPLSYSKAGLPVAFKETFQSQRNPITSAQLTERDSVLEMQDLTFAAVAATGKRTNRPISTKSDVSLHSETTLKWVGATDAVFRTRQTAQTGQAQNQPDSGESDIPTWQCVSEDTQSSRRTSGRTSGRISGSTLSPSASTFSAGLTQLRLAFQQAADLAHYVLNPIQQQFRFKDFHPLLFARIRAIIGISPKEYAISFEETCKAKFSDGRSGAFMFYSKDQKYIVKTTTKEEMADLQSILVAYMEYMENNPNSLLVRFLGAHCLTMYGAELYFVVMLNIFPAIKLSEIYDLKGSWENRYGFTAESRKGRVERKRIQEGQTPLYLDNDLQHQLALDQRAAYSLADQISLDIAFLASKMELQ